ncbi:MAG: hypothetical protein HC825_12630 [Oscillatoriales cyanobacterium RM1_1_9]|nr:hypothetical protein [Oscillatoriales cyanobacterium RM1_1_9]
MTSITPENFLDLTPGPDAIELQPGALSGFPGACGPLRVMIGLQVPQTPN